jgi:hypothetical protein
MKWPCGKIEKLHHESTKDRKYENDDMKCSDAWGVMYSWGVV